MKGERGLERGKETSTSTSAVHTRAGAVKNTRVSEPKNKKRRGLTQIFYFCIAVCVTPQNSTQHPHVYFQVLEPACTCAAELLRENGLSFACWRNGEPSVRVFVLAGVHASARNHHTHTQLTHPPQLQLLQRGCGARRPGGLVRIWAHISRPNRGHRGL